MLGKCQDKWHATKYEQKNTREQEVVFMRIKFLSHYVIIM